MRVCLLQRERDAGIKYLQESLLMSRDIDDFQGIGQCQMYLAWLDVREGRPQDALGRLAPLRQRLGEQGLPPVYLAPIYAEAQMNLGHEERAAEILAEVRVLVETGRARLDLVDVLRVSAMLATCQQRWEDAVRDLGEGLQLTKDVGLPYDEELLLYEYARMHQARGEPEQARERLTSALAIFQQLGARPDVERTEQALRGMGVVSAETT